MLSKSMSLLLLILSVMMGLSLGLHGLFCPNLQILVLISSPPRVLPDNPKNSSSCRILFCCPRSSRDSEAVHLSRNWNIVSVRAANYLFFFKILFIHERDTHKGRGRGRSRFPATWDSIPGPQDHDLSQKLKLN